MISPAIFLLLICVAGKSYTQNCDFSDLHISDCQWQASQSQGASSGLQWQVFDEAGLSEEKGYDENREFDTRTRTPSSLLTKYALLKFGVLFNATKGTASLLSTSVSPFLRCLTFWYRANASPFNAPIVAPNPSSAHSAPWPTFRLKLVGGNEGPGVETETTLLYTLPLQPGAVDGDRWQFRELSIPAVKSHYRIMLEVEVPRRVVSGYVAIDNVAFQARCDAGLHSSYSMWPGNCRGNFIMDWGEPAGCRRCSLEECAVMCDSYSNCDGFSYATGASTSGSNFFEYPSNYQCYLKQGTCSNPSMDLPYAYFAKSTQEMTGEMATPPPAVTERKMVTSRRVTETARYYENNVEEKEENSAENKERGTWPHWARKTTRIQRWMTPVTETTPAPAPPTPRVPRVQPAPPSILMPQVEPNKPFMIPAVFDDRYEQLDGNCGGNFLFRNGLRVGCQGCSLEECKQLCSKFEMSNAQEEDGSGGSLEQFGSRCLGFSFTGRTDVEPRCLLKSMNYCVPSYNTLGYFFYRKILDSPGHPMKMREHQDQPTNTTRFN